MKLLKIKMRNLNSLRGEHELDFTQAPLARKGLFLITGETGAGKTTILDAITLALYGKTPRAQNWTSGSEKEMLSYGESECLAEVEFESGEERYRCSWQFGLTRTGNPKTPKRELAQLRPEDKILATKHAEVDEKVAEVLKGLDYNRFIRSVLLAQGDFTEFLKGEAERSLILERVTNTSVYSEIGYAAYHKLQEEKKLLERLDLRLGDLKYLNEEERTAIEQERAELQTERKALEELLKKDELAFQWLRNLEKLEAERAEVVQRREEAEAALRVLQPKKERLEQHQKAVNFRKDFKQKAVEKQELQRLERSIADLKKSVAEGAEQLAQLAEQKEAQRQASSLFQEKEKVQQQILQKARKIQTQWEAESAALQKLQAQYEKLKAKTQSAQQQLEKLSSQQQEGAAEKLATIQWLEQHANYSPLVEQDWLSEYQSLEMQWLQAHKQLQKLQVREQQLQEQCKEKETEQQEALSAQKAAAEAGKTAQSAFEELTQEADPEQEGLERFVALRKRRETAAERLQRLEQLAEKIEKRDEQTKALGKADTAHENIEIQLHRAEEDMERILFGMDQQKGYLEELQSEERALDVQMGLSERREQLQEGEPCPLCGSEEHPYRKRSESFLPKTYELIQEKKEKVEAKLQKEQANYQRVQVEHRKLEQEYRSLDKERQQQQKRLEELEAEVDALVKLLGHSPIFEDVQRLKTEITKQQSFQREEGQRIEQLERHWNQLEQSRRAQEQAQQQLQSSQARLEELQKEQQELQKEAEQEQAQQGEQEQALRQQLQGVQRALSSFSAKRLEVLRLELQTIQQDYKAKQEQLRANEQREALLAQEYQQRQEQLQETEEALKSLQIDLEGQEAKSSQLQKQQSELLEGQTIEELEQSLQKEREQILERLQNLEKAVQEQALGQERSKSQLEGKEQQFQEGQSKLNQSLAELEAAVKAVGFADTEAARLALLEEAEAKAMAEEQQQQERLLQKLQDQEATLSEKKKVLQAEAVTEELKEDLAERIDDGKQAQAELLKQEGELNNRLKEDAQRRTEARELIEAREQQQQQYKRWERLYKLIGKSPNSGGSHKFRDFAQGITLDKLLRYTNQHLAVFFNERYELKRNSDTSLEIDIVDTFQANYSRRLSTLSGGETFLVSLSLALGLSDLASHQADLRSLFVDEGFGSLDAETLNVAMTALHALEAKGKSIGLISHVERLKDRIATQVQVRKRGNGFSEVKVVED